MAFAGTFDFGSVIVAKFPVITDSLAIIGPDSLVRVGDMQLNDTVVSIVGGATLEAGRIASGRFTLSDQGALIVDQALQDTTISLDSTSSVNIGGSGGGVGLVTIASDGTGVDLVANVGIVDDGRLVYDSASQGDVESISGDGSLVLHDGTVDITDSIAGVSVAFEGYGALELDPQETFSVFGLKIADFGEGDTIEVGQGSTAETFLKYVAQSAHAGELDLVNADGSIIDSFALAGDYVTDRFLLQQIGATDLITLLPAHVDQQVGPGTPNGEVFTLKSAPGPLVWSDPASWLSSSGTAATVAPGALDTANLDATNFNPFVVGTAIVRVLSTGASATLDGNFTAATVDTAGMILAGAGSELNAGTLNETYQYPYLPPAAALTVDRGHVAIGVGNLNDLTVLRDGGFLSATSLTFADLSIDPTSRAVIGPTGAGVNSFSAGALTVEAGMTLQDSGLLQAGLVNDGVVSVSGAEISGAVSGDGTFDLGSAGPGAILTFDGSVSSSIRIDFVAGLSSLVFGQASGSHGEMGGFTIGDKLVFSDLLDAARAVFEPAGDGNSGTLVLEDQNHQALATVGLLGDYSGAHFAVAKATNAATITITSFHPP